MANKTKQLTGENLIASYKMILLRSNKETFYNAVSVMYLSDYISDIAWDKFNEYFMKDNQN